MSRYPRLLDLFCKAGGATKGYQEAGFYVVGVDIEPQPNYCGDKFIQADILAFSDDDVKEFDIVHASPPCQASTTLKARQGDKDYPELIPAVRELLAPSGLPYVIENVPGAALIEPIVLCGSAFGLGVRRHRLFESNVALMSPGCSHALQPPRFDIYERGRWFKSPVARVYGSGGGKAREHWDEAMGIDWMNTKELAQAIPPAYTKFIGEQLVRHLDQRRKTTLSNIRKTRPTSATKTKTIAART